VHQLKDRREDGADGAIVLGEFFIQPCLELREPSRNSRLELTSSRKCTKARTT
jgi:hypothetical protein